MLRPPYRASPYWGDDGASRMAPFIAARAPLRTVLVAMRDAGFAAFRARDFRPRGGRAAAAPARDRWRAFDVIGEVERFTGRTLDPTIEVVLLEFCKPHGIKVIGQKFLSAIDWRDDVVIRTAGHELLHPAGPG